MRRSHVWISLVPLGLLVSGFILGQDSQSTTNPKKKDKAAPARETVAKPLTEKQKKAREAKLKKELMTPYRKWMNEDVAYIITDEERKAFNQLQTYKKENPSLFPYNDVLVISDGLEARIGTLTADWERFMPWRTIEGADVAPKGTP